MKVIGLVFLFTVRLRFPRSQSIADVIRKRYGDRGLKDVIKFERLDYHARKYKLLTIRAMSLQTFHNSTSRIQH